MGGHPRTLLNAISWMSITVTATLQAFAPRVDPSALGEAGRELHVGLRIDAQQLPALEHRTADLALRGEQRDEFLERRAHVRRDVYLTVVVEQHAVDIAAGMEGEVRHMSLDAGQYVGVAPVHGVPCRWFREKADRGKTAIGIRHSRRVGGRGAVGPRGCRVTIV